jgi:hypothetical protein
MTGTKSPWLLKTDETIEPVLDCEDGEDDDLKAMRRIVEFCEVYPADRAIIALALSIAYIWRCTQISVSERATPESDLLLADTVRDSIKTALQGMPVIENPSELDTLRGIEEFLNINLREGDS